MSSDDESDVWNLPPPPPVPPDPIEYNIPHGQIARGANARLIPQVQHFEDVRARRPRIEFPNDSDITVDPDKVEGRLENTSKPLIQNPVRIISEDGSINVYFDKFGVRHDLNKLKPRPKPTFRNLPPRRDYPPPPPSPPIQNLSEETKARDRARARNMLPPPIPPAPVLPVTPLEPYPRADDRRYYREMSRVRDMTSQPPPRDTSGTVKIPAPVFRVTKDGRIVQEDRIDLR